MTHGFCECGCGERTAVAKINDRSKGWVKGRPLRFIRGHSGRVTMAQRSAAAIGKRTRSSHGYILVRCADGARRYEHILVAERTLGRPLKDSGRGHPQTEVVHHVNGIKHDNRPENLLICTHQYHVELHARLERSPDWPEFSPRVNHPRGCRRVGKSGFKGVELGKAGRWLACITLNGRSVSLGSYPTAEEAARAYDAAALRHHGDAWITNASMGLFT